MVSGKLPKEPMASYGPFFMNTPEKIQQAPRRLEKNQHVCKIRYDYTSIDDSTSYLT